MSYPPTWRISQRLVRIAECQRLFRHAGILPGDSTTLSKLVSLTDERYQELLDNGTIHPNMGRKDIVRARAAPDSLERNLTFGGG